MAYLNARFADCATERRADLTDWDQRRQCALSLPLRFSTNHVWRVPHDSRRERAFDVERESNAGLMRQARWPITSTTLKLPTTLISPQLSNYDEAIGNLDDGDQEFQ